MVEYGKALSGGIRFSIQPKRWLPFFILDAVAMTAFLAYMLSNISVFTSIASSIKADVLSVLPSILGIAGISVALFLIWIMIKIYISGAIIHQSVKPKEARRSWTVSKERYLTLIAIAAIVSIASGIGGMVPYVGWAISIILSLVFFFSMPPAIVNKMSFDKSISVSIELFRNKMADVFLSWLLIAVISSVIVFVLAVPLMLVSIGIFLPYLIGQQSGTSGTEILKMLLQSGWSLYPALLVFVAGISISNVFSLFAQTNLYTQLGKRKLV